MGEIQRFGIRGECVREDRPGSVLEEASDGDLVRFIDCEAEVTSLRNKLKAVLDREEAYRSAVAFGCISVLSSADREKLIAVMRERLQPREG